MEQLEFFSLPSPCKGICQSNSRGLCLGCFRSREERFQWQQMTVTQQRNVLRLTWQRRARFMRQQQTPLTADETQQKSQQGLLFDDGEL